MTIHLNINQLFTVLALLLMLTFPTQATHIIGAEISYTPVNNYSDRYIVTAKLYREAYAAANFDPTIPLHCRRNSCDNADPTNLTFQLSRTTTRYTSYLGCTGGQVVEIQEFTGEVNLQLGNWTLSIAQENRTNGIRNLTNSINLGLYTDAQLNVIRGVAPNTSPVFTSVLLPYICGTQFHRFSFATFDAEGDSLVYSLIAPQSASAANPCAQVVPGTFNPHFTINAATGELSTMPFVLDVGNYTMATRVEEYRRVSSQWIKIGSVMRDIMYPVRTSNGNRNPTFASLTVGTSTQQPVDQIIRVNPGQTAVLTLTAADQDAGQTLRFSSSATIAIPGITFQTVSTTQSRLTWQVPATTLPGRYTVPINVFDNSCPINGSEVRTLTFQVTNQVLPIHPRKEPFLSLAYPNPFQEQVQFQISSGVQQIVIVDGLGRVVDRLLSRSDGTVVWRPIASLAPGLYMARTINGQQVVHLSHE